MPGWVVALLVLVAVGVAVQSVPLPVWVARLGRRRSPLELPPADESSSAELAELSDAVRCAHEAVAFAVSGTEDLVSVLPLAAWLARLSSDNWARSLIEDVAGRQAAAREAVARLDHVLACGRWANMGGRLDALASTTGKQTSRALALVTRDGQEGRGRYPSRSDAQAALDELRSTAAELSRIQTVIHDHGPPYR